MTPTVFALDAAWGGTGWAVATAQGPVAAGHLVIGPSARMAKLAAFLDERVPLLQGSGHIELVIERPLAVYSGASRGQAGKAGNQAATGYGMGRLAGAIELWWWSAARREARLVTPNEWRAFWRVHGDRAACKAAAVQLCAMAGWRAHLPATGADDGPRGDVAEAILMAVACARNPKLLEAE